MKTTFFYLKAMFAACLTLAIFAACSDDDEEGIAGAHQTIDHAPERLTPHALVLRQQRNQHPARKGAAPNVNAQPRYP